MDDIGGQFSESFVCLFDAKMAVDKSDIVSNLLGANETGLVRIYGQQGDVVMDLYQETAFGHGNLLPVILQLEIVEAAAVDADGKIIMHRLVFLAYFSVLEMVGMQPKQTRLGVFVRDDGVGQLLLQCAVVRQ